MKEIGQSLISSSAQSLQQAPSPQKERSMRNPGLCVALCLIGMLSVPLIRAQIVQPQEPVDPSPINGEMYFFINQISGLQMDLNNNSSTPGDNILVNSRSFSSLGQRWAFTKVPGSDECRPDGPCPDMTPGFGGGSRWVISNLLNGLCLDTAGSHDLVQKRCAIDAPTQEWSLSYVKNGYNVVMNVATRLVLDVSDASATPGAKLIESRLMDTPAQGQLWLFRPVFSGETIRAFRKRRNMTVSWRTMPARTRGGTTPIFPVRTLSRSSRIMA